ncbi:MAG TPA: OB-fold domain-containing protein [Candidatus Binataceae bacterium]|nr:OB-fold domain-containing protein [Candidatus Binataceae bacterium]
MSNRKAVHPELYPADPAGDPVIYAGKCAACGYVFFPPQRYGCEACGALPERLETAPMPARGRLHSYATVHLYQGKDLAAPFVIGVVVLNGGPAIRATLTNRDEAGLAIGDPMRGVLVGAGTDPDGSELVELRFAKDEARR